VATQEPRRRSRRSSLKARAAPTPRLGRTSIAGSCPRLHPGITWTSLLDEPGYDKKWSADDPKHGCVVDKINEFRATLKDKTKTVEDRRFALRFLIHSVEDMHMPMHVGDNHDRGGNNT
jgi:S1/P1 Nuclease